VALSHRDFKGRSIDGAARIGPSIIDMAPYYERSSAKSVSAAIWTVLKTADGVFLPPVP